MKTFRYALLSLLLMLLAACAQQDDAVPVPTSQPAATEAADTAEAPAPEAGVHYVEIEDAQPYLPLDGQVEVVEVFGYTCPACASFEPLVSAWKQRQPDAVRVTLLAAPFGGAWQSFAKAYYAAEALDLAEATHKPMFDAIHRERSLQGASTEAIADFYASQGADAREFAQTMESFAVSGQLRRAEGFVQRAGVDSTPTMVVNGKYRVVPGQDFQEVLRIVDHLVEMERSAGEAGGPAVEEPALEEAAAEEPAAV